jgi:hypothetical protein
VYGKKTSNWVSEKSYFVFNIFYPNLDKFCKDRFVLCNRFTNQFVQHLENPINQTQSKGSYFR